LLKLPLMPELKALPPGAVKGFNAAAVDLETIKYVDKVREKARIARLAAKKAERAQELEQQATPQQRSGVRDAKVKPAAANAAKAARVDDSEGSDDDDGSDDGGSVSSSSSSSGGGSSSSQCSSKASKPSSAAKRMRKGRKKVRVLAVGDAARHALRLASLAAVLHSQFYSGGGRRVEHKKSES
jgi:hypothetical protein